MAILEENQEILHYDFNHFSIIVILTNKES